MTDWVRFFLEQGHRQMQTPDRTPAATGPVGDRSPAVGDVPPSDARRCECGHAKRAHIYDEGACRPGFICTERCGEYREQGRDRHAFKLKLDGGWVNLTVECPYDATDETRPCWPHDEDSTPEPAPQDECTYSGWVENLSIEEILHGEAEFPLRAEVEWNDGMEVHLRCGAWTDWIPLILERGGYRPPAVPDRRPVTADPASGHSFAVGDRVRTTFTRQNGEVLTLHGEVVGLAEVTVQWTDDDGASWRENEPIESLEIDAENGASPVVP